MSALKHGFFRAGFMLCDRCAINARCERFSPGAECVLEREAYDWLVGELTEQYGLEGLADQILAGRVAMYLIRIARAETYESVVGVTEKSALWGAYISRLDNTLRGLMKDLAITRAKRKRLEKGEALLVSVDDLLEKFVKKSEVRARKVVVGRGRRRRIERAPMRALLKDWRRERRKLLLTVRRVESVGEEEDSYEGCRRVDESVRVRERTPGRTGHRDIQEVSGADEEVRGLFLQ